MTLADLYFVEPGTELERKVEETRNTGQGVEAARLASKRFAKLLANVTTKPGSLGFRGMQNHCPARKTNKKPAHV